VALIQRVAVRSSAIYALAYRLKAYIPWAGDLLLIAVAREWPKAKEYWAFRERIFFDEGNLQTFRRRAPVELLRQAESL